MVFCFENFSYQLSEKFVLEIEKSFCEFETEGQELAKILSKGFTGHHVGSGESENFQNLDCPETGRFPSRMPDF